MVEWEIADENDSKLLRSSLLCSCHLPFLPGSSVPALRGRSLMDGGLTEQFPACGELPALRVSPFRWPVAMAL
jgi:hypothetical protein